MSELSLVEKVVALEGVGLLGNLGPDQMASIAAIATEVRLPPGRVILEAGKPVDALYVIVEGSAEMSRDGESIDKAEHNAVLGAWGLFDEHEPGQLGARTIEDTRLLRIGRDEFYDLLADNGEMVSGIFAALAHRFRRLVEE